MSLLRLLIRVITIGAAAVPYATVAEAQPPFDVLHTFTGHSDPMNPADAPLVEGLDGNLYGISSKGGGPLSLGTIFKVTKDGSSLTTVHSFTSAESGLERTGPVTLLRASDGSLYGMEANNPLVANLFRVATDGTVTVNAISPTPLSANPAYDGDPMFQGADGNFYWFWGHYKASRITPAGQLSRLSLGAADLFFSRTAVVLAADGNFYVAGYSFGSGVLGRIVRLTTSGALTSIHDFAGAADGAGPYVLVQGLDGNLYGMTGRGGSFNAGTFFRLTLAGDLTTLFSFPRLTMVSSLLTASDGNFYGTATSLTGDSRETGSIFRVTATGELTLLHTGGVDGAPPGPLMQASDGNFYGTTKTGGEQGLGSVFRMSPGGAVTNLRVFTWGPEGYKPAAALVQARDGAFYGTSANGGAFDRGTIFRVAASGALTNLYNFTGGSDGGYPSGALAQASDGNLYGTTAYGGAADKGTLFRVTPAGALTVLHAFSGADGANPSSGLTAAADGNLYGTSSGGGPFYNGTVFRMTLGGAFTVLHDFTGGDDGRTPLASLTQTATGGLYGTTSLGGLFGKGTIFRLGPEGFNVVHSFTAQEGEYPQASLIEASDGNLYGTLSCGGSAVFRITPAGILTVLHSFNLARCYYSYGPPPIQIAVTAASDDSLYVTMQTFGGSYGVIYRMTRDGIMSTVHLFTGGADGAFPLAGLVQAADGNLYGTATGICDVVCSAPAGVTFRVGLLPSTVAGNLRTQLAVFRPSSGAVVVQGQSPVLIGAAGDIPVPGDYDGDGRLDVALYRPSTSVWSIVGVGIVPFGAPGDIPVPADYDGDGKTDLAVFRPSTGQWLIAGQAPVAFGSPGDIPVPGDYTGEGRAQLAVYRRGTFFIAGHGAFTVGAIGDIPVPADYDGDGRVDMAVYQRATGTWIVTNPFATPALSVAVAWGGPGDVPVPQDLDGDKHAELIVYRRATHTWFTYNTVTRETSTQVFGLGADVPLFAPRWIRAVPGDFDRDRRADVAVYRPGTGEWFLRTSLSVGTASFGGLGDVPVPGDYDGDGRVDVAVFRPRTGEWFIRPWAPLATAHLSWGSPALGDIPVAADYDGDGITDVAVYRRSTGEWFIHRSSDGATTYARWGNPSLQDLPAPGDFDGDGQADVAVYRASTGEWFIHRSVDEGTTYVSGGGASPGAVPVVADYDGDGKADLAVFQKDGVWSIVRSSDGGVFQKRWGNPAVSDVAVPSDFDGDGRTDVAVYRRNTGEWFILGSALGFSGPIAWGSPAVHDVPVVVQSIP